MVRLASWINWDYCMPQAMSGTRAWRNCTWYSSCNVTLEFMTLWTWLKNRVSCPNMAERAVVAAENNNLARPKPLFIFPAEVAEAECQWHPLQALQSVNTHYNCVQISVDEKQDSKVLFEAKLHSWFSIACMNNRPLKCRKSR